MLRNLGQAAKNDHQRLGYNMRLDPIQAIVLSLKLPHLDETTKNRQAAASRYDKLIDEAKLPVHYVRRHPDATHVHHLYTVKLLAGDRENVRERMAKEGIDTGIYYPALVADQPFYPHTYTSGVGVYPKDLPRDACPVAADAARSILSLPLHEATTPEEQRYVITTLGSALQ
mgnify:CR=1 FL=1